MTQETESPLVGLSSLNNSIIKSYETVFGFADKISNFYGQKREEIALKIIFGAAKGIDPVSSIQNIYFINGVFCVKTDTALAKALSLGLVEFQVTELDDGFRVTGRRDGNEELYEYTYTREMAINEGFWITKEMAEKNKTLAKSYWYRFPARTMKYKAVSRFLKDYFPDAIQDFHLLEDAYDYKDGHEFSENGLTFKSSDKDKSEVMSDAAIKAANKKKVIQEDEEPDLKVVSTEETKEEKPESKADSNPEVEEKKETEEALEQESDEEEKEVDEEVDSFMKNLNKKSESFDDEKIDAKKVTGGEIETPSFIKLKVSNILFRKHEEEDDIYLFFVENPKEMIHTNTLLFYAKKGIPFIVKNAISMSEGELGLKVRLFPENNPPTELSVGDTIAVMADGPLKRKLKKQAEDSGLFFDESTSQDTGLKKELAEASGEDFKEEDVVIKNDVHQVDNPDAVYDAKWIKSKDWKYIDRIMIAKGLMTYKDKLKDYKIRFTKSKAVDFIMICDEKGSEAVEEYYNSLIDGEEVKKASVDAKEFKERSNHSVGKAVEKDEAFENDIKRTEEVAGDEDDAPGVGALEDKEPEAAKENPIKRAIDIDIPGVEKGESRTFKQMKVINGYFEVNEIDEPEIFERVKKQLDLPYEDLEQLIEEGSKKEIEAYIQTA